MLRTRPLALAFALLCSIMLPTVCMTASGQTASPTVHKLSLTAAVVLAPEFCATKTKKGTWMANWGGRLCGYRASAQGYLFQFDQSRVVRVVWRCTTCVDAEIR
jgi:hypothetical protein